MPGLLFQPTTSLADMGNMGNVPPQFTLDAIQAMRQRQSADTQTLADLPSAIQHEQAMRPLDEQRTQSLNDLTQAQVGLTGAQSRMENMKADEMQQTQQARIQDMIGKYGHEKMQRYADEMQQLGPLMQQAGTIAGTNGTAAAKKILTDAGHGDMWNDFYDRLNPSQLSQVLYGQGKQISETLPTYQKAIDTAALKAQYAMALEQRRIESREAIATQRTQTARDMKMEELNFKNTHQTPNYQQLSARYNELARQALADGNNEQAAAFDTEAKRTQQLALQFPTVAGNIANQGKPDIAAVTGGAVPTLNPNRTATTTPGAEYPERGGPQQSTAQPKSAQQAQSMGWKLHEDKDGNRAYVSPDGKSYYQAN